MTVHYAAFYVDDSKAPPKFSELERVRTRVPLREGKVTVPAGATGTIVYVYAGKSAVEVEFTSPVHAVIGVPVDDLERIDD